MLRELCLPFIMIDGNNTVQNIAMFYSYQDANEISKAIYGDNAFAEEYRYLVHIGDIYKNGIFYNIDENGEEIPAQYIGTQDDKISQLEKNKFELEKELTDTQLALTEQYEAKIALEEEVTHTQIALTEIYENMEV